MTACRLIYAYRTCAKPRLTDHNVITRREGREDGRDYVDYTVLCKGGYRFYRCYSRGRRSYWTVYKGFLPPESALKTAPSSKGRTQ